MRQDMAEMTGAPGAPVVGKQMVHLGLPPGVRIVLLRHHGAFPIPHGGTVLEAGDTLQVRGEPQELAGVRTLGAVLRQSVREPVGRLRCST
jgi:Trk K+ transport system NAD-binding subunit